MGGYFWNVVTVLVFLLVMTVVVVGIMDTIAITRDERERAKRRHPSYPRENE